MQEQVGDTVVIIIVLSAMAIGLISMLVGYVVERWDRFCVWWKERSGRASVKHSQSVMSPNHATRKPDRTLEPEPERSASEPHGTTADGSENQDELTLNADEIEAINRMIKHNTTAAKPSKSSTIQAGFGVSRGGSAAYVRASLIYDALFGQPEPAVTTPIAGRRTRARFTPNAQN